MFMSYHVLARKWRPRSFQDIVGQGPIVRMLSNALSQKRIHHAYLFTGTRGVGKTTLARILAKCLNCASGITASPCGHCAICLAMDAGRFLDLYEVDAASRTKVEDTRDLLDHIHYAPSQGRYKIYIIDEVHMLSSHSFNALLKTLEEPPEHVKFLLATTDPKRLPVTVLSRCLQFHLKQIAQGPIAEHLQHICNAENIDHEGPALAKIAKAADGSMRDALSLLDQAIAYGQGKVEDALVNVMLGCIAQEDVLPLLDALAAQDGEQLFQAIASLAERVPDFAHVLEELISIFHRLAIAQMVPNAMALEGPLAAFGQRFTAEEMQLYYQIALLGKRDLALAPSPQQGFEMTMLRMLAFKLDAGEKAKAAAPTPAPAAKPQPTVDIAGPLLPLSPPLAAPPPAAALSGPPLSATMSGIAEWREVLPKLELTGMAYALAVNCTLEKMAGNKVTLALAAHHQPMLNQKLRDRIAEALGRHFQQNIQLEIKITTSPILTPIGQAQSEQEKRLATAKQTILADPQVKKFIEMYDATVEEITLLSS
jgi:DNA polymerase-3 subunit gamma/tau